MDISISGVPKHDCLGPGLLEDVTHAPEVIGDRRHGNHRILDELSGSEPALRALCDQWARRVAYLPEPRALPSSSVAATDPTPSSLAQRSRNAIPDSTLVLVALEQDHGGGALSHISQEGIDC